MSITLDSGFAGWIEIGSALLAPLIAVVVAYIAYQQMKTNRRRLAFELFDARYEIYHACRDLILDVGGRKRELGHMSFMEFDAATGSAEFLLEVGAREFIGSLRDRAQELVGIEEELATRPDQNRRDELVRRQLEIWKWFRSQLSELNGAFCTSLTLAAS